MYDSTLYWVEGGGDTPDMSPKIEMAALDGSHRTTVVATNLGTPRGITVDHKVGEEGGRIYWTDELFGWIYSASLDGSNRRQEAGE